MPSLRSEPGAERHVLRAHFLNSDNEEDHRMPGRLHALRTSAAVVALTAAAGAATAQDTDQQPQAQQTSQCLAELSSFGRDLATEQFWVTGWGYGPGFGQPGVAGTVPPATGPAETVNATPGDPALADPTVPPSPWSAAGVTASPRYDIRVLYMAAQVLAQNGEEEGCQYVLGQMQQTYNDYVAQLQDAGVDPALIVDWRHERIALAQPVDELPDTFTLTVDELLGTDVRNPADAYLGSVSDVVLDRQTGDIRYVIVARGGFLGIGEDTIPVPWQRFRLAPGLNTLVLDVEEAQFEAAPQIADGEVGAGQRYGEVDAFWGG